jgi:hypothetical protein
MSVMVKSKLERLRTAHVTVAKLVVNDPVYLSIFRRIEAELSVEEAKAGGDAIAYARAVMVVQRQ